ncbi:hypothetical protein SCRM01_151c [Synechococcus phage S-CRM01]|uniref:hypothetical protein n=1 Tax=Synechococcus phage S-CRM01 TaxID=1026955 RepID=UPI000209E3E8|nr:hypothetical protein SCRM01_151c [Synechococcus phage S-CRM01]AEC53097.1 hypothetical protein SCRM01_151c [Synechococcus phage S-CRM01]
MTIRMRERFEEWVISNRGQHMLSEQEHPLLWKGTKEQIQSWENNPYSHPWTAGAYESWKHLYPYMGGPRG